MKVISKGGIVLPVDDSAITDGDYVPAIQQVTLIADGLNLVDRWLVKGYKNPHGYDSQHDEACEIFTYVYYKEPTEEQLIHFMSEHGLGMYDFCSLEKIKYLAFE